MFFDEFITKEITNLTSDDSTQSMFMLHRYLLCSYAICTYILRGEKDSSLIKDAKSCLDNLKVAVAYLDNLLEDSVSDSKKEQTKLKNAFDETWSYVAKEVENYVNSNFITRKGIVKQLKLANFYACQVIRAILVVEERDDYKNLTNLKN